MPKPCLHRFCVRFFTSKAGFAPPESVASLAFKDQANLALVYPPGEQVDPTVTASPWYSREWDNLTAPAAEFTVPPQQINGTRGGGWWPPRPTLKVNFMPKIEAGTGRGWRLYPMQINPTASTNKADGTEHNMAVLKEDTRKLGWMVDEGDLEGAKTNTHTGQTATYGWRCTPKMAWYQNNWREMLGVVVPPFVHGAARDIGTYVNGASTCPDGRPNAWEATVPNGVYVITAGFASHYGKNGCSFENVRAAGGSHATTYTYSAEVSDGKFTLSSGTPTQCQSVSWLKLDLVSTTLYPRAWLPSPPNEWWQLQLDADRPKIGLVQIIVPHQGYRTADSYPHNFDPDSPDCRKWWLYTPAKCFRMLTRSSKRGVHPELAVYPDFPGFTKPFLGWLFDKHDTDGNGELTRGEFSAAQLSEVVNNGPYALWPRSGCPNCKGTPGFHDDAIAHLWRKMDVLDSDRSNGAQRGDGKVTRSEFVSGPLNMPQNRPCDLFEQTGNTHGANLHNGRTDCAREKGGPVPTHWGWHDDDGSHGFRVTVSDVPCTDKGGCPSVDDKGANVTVCEMRLHHTSTAPAQINCKGATGKYVQISLPGAGNRLIPKLKVDVHRASHPNIKNGRNQAYKATDPALPTVCYGVQRRAVPAADDPNLLSGTKEHPKIVVDDNPEDPIFWSTCYDRVKIREWLPLADANKNTNATAATSVFRFNDGKHCLNCYSMRQNLGGDDGYDMDHMLTPRWWLQPKGQCQSCDHTFKYTTRPTASKDTVGTCPSTHPWAYRPDHHFDYCCASTMDKAGNVGANFGPRATRGKSCKSNHFVRCSAPPCKDYSAGYRLGMRGSDTCPNGMKTTTLNECEAASKALVPTGVAALPLISAYWHHVPAGCSSQAGSYKPHFCTNPSGEHTTHLLVRRKPCHRARTCWPGRSHRPCD